MRRDNVAAVDPARRLDARQKIELGGLVVKAGLREADRAFILGGLIQMARLDPSSAEAERLRGLGNRAFLDPGSKPQAAE